MSAYKAFLRGRIVHAMKRGNQGRALRIGRALAKRYAKDESSWDILARAASLFEGVTEAEVVLRAGLSECPNSLLLGDQLALVLRVQSRHVEATELLEGLAERYPSSPRPYVGLASVWLGLGDLDRARDYVNQAARLTPHADREAVLSLGVTMLRIPGKESEAESLLMDLAGKDRKSVV